VVVYYLYAGPLDLTQIEILVAFPLLAAWWLIDGAEPGTRKGLRRYAGAGLVAASVVLMKYPYVLIVLAFLAYAVLRSPRRGIRLRNLRWALAAFFIALLASLLIVVVYFAAHGQLGKIWWAYFELGAAQLTGSRPLDYLAVWGRRFTIGHGPIMIMAALGSVHALRERARPESDLAAGMLLWGTVGAVAFLTQGWYEYKLLLFIFPLGILAVLGVEALISIAGSVGRERRLLALAAMGGLAVLTFAVSTPPRIQTLLLVSVVIGCCVGVMAGFFALRPRVLRRVAQVLLATLAVSVGLTAIGPANKVGMLVRHDFALTVELRADLQRSWNPLYRAVDRDLEVLGSRLQPGALQVFGDPLLQLRANRRPATPFVSLRPELYDDRAWRQVYSGLRSTLPPNIVIDTLLRSSIQRRFPAILELVLSRYKVALVGSAGTWYVRRDLMASVAAGDSCPL
jgi:4-amino-4-deoxy-L-arabinose transferase-like glycosyltransferase